MNLEILLGIFVLFFLYFYYFHGDIIGSKTVDTFRVGSSQPRTFCINLDKDSHRYENLQRSYYASDMKHIMLERYSAILGATVNIEQWLSPSAINEFYVVKKNGYRTHHYQLTTGAVGCFLSHYYLAKQLLDDYSVDTYLILFWGMGTYLLNKKGARKIVDEVEQNKIDGQIDAYLSRMSQQNRITLYASNIHISKNVGRDTNIQIEINPISGMNPFEYKGFVV